MCLGVPGLVKEILPRDEAGVAWASVDFGGLRRRVCAEALPELEVGQWVLVHVGFALSRLDEAAAHELLATLRELSAIAEDPGGEP